MAAALAAGCSTTEPPVPPAPVVAVPTSDGFEDVLNRPDLLLQRAEAARLANKRELAYRYYALIHQLHPESKEDPQAFIWAARLGKRFQETTLVTDSNSIWITAERAFLYQWFEELATDEFPETHARALLVDSSYRLAREFLEHTQTRPALAQWTITVKEDNGRVFAVEWIPVSKGKKGRAAR